METRLATKDDAVLLAALHEKSFGAARWTPAQVADSLALDTTLVLVVQENKMPQGFIMCQVVGAEAEILTFCIIPEKRRRSAGTFLLKETLEKLKSKNIRKIFLEVAANNVAALDLYKKAGFLQTGKRQGYYARSGGLVDAVTMSLEFERRQIT
jgi:[ribosomal protein S18]-alanine N-acetyltransferase